MVCGVRELGAGGTTGPGDWSALKGERLRWSRPRTALRETAGRAICQGRPQGPGFSRLPVATGGQTASGGLASEPQATLSIPVAAVCSGMGRPLFLLGSPALASPPDHSGSTYSRGQHSSSGWGGGPPEDSNDPVSGISRSTITQQLFPINPQALDKCSKAFIPID